MELNNTYFEEGIIDIIFNSLDYTDKFSFSKLNRFTRKYKGAIKYQIFNLINNEYDKYKLLMIMYRFNQNELLDLGIIAVSGINMLWGTTLTGYYDLRYIFELIFAGLNIYHPSIKENCKGVNLFYLIRQIKLCLSFNRFETIKNINNHASLRVLNTAFIPLKSNDKKWITIN